MTTMQELLSGMFRSYSPREDEYINPTDGLVYCKACGTPRQTRITFPGTEEYFCPPVPCKCLREKREQEEQERKQRQFALDVSRMRTAGLQDRALRDYTFANDLGYTPQITKAHRYVEHFETMEDSGEGLLLWGDVGSGKTFMAGCIANALLDRRIPVLMTNFSRILLRLTSNFSEDKNSFLDELDRYRLLIIDDLGIERNSDFALEQVYSVIDRRSRSGKPMIITTNLPLTALKNPTDIAHARIYGRVLERCLPIKVCGNRIREQKAAASFKDMRDLLGD